MAGGSRQGFDLKMADAMFLGLEQCLSAAPSNQATVGLLAKYRRRLSALESKCLADLKAAGSSDRQNESAARATGASKRAARAAAARAAAVAENRALADALASGDIGESELDAIAMASSETDGAGAVADDLFDQVKSAGPDKAGAVARQWVDERKAQDEHDSRYDKQRRRRKLCRFTTRRGTDALMAEGDTETIDRLMALISARADDIYKADGGRDLSAAKHPRSYDQRMFDAFTELMTESPGSGSRDAATVHIITYADDWADSGPTSGFSLDGRRLPTKLLRRMACNASFVGTVFGRDGEVLFHGRKKRLATTAQFRALVARDRGCVQCGADPGRCQAHHLTPYNSPNAGKTNIDEMALMCHSCHDELHQNEQTLYWAQGPPQRGPTRTWQTRPATPNEIAPKRKPRPAA